MSNKKGVIFLIVLLIFFILYIKIPLFNSQNVNENEVIVSSGVIEQFENNIEWVPVIIILDEKDSDKVDLLINSLSSSEFILKKKLYGDYAFAGNVNKEGLEKLKYNQDIKYIYFNRLVDIQLTQSLPLINATTVWASLNYTGRGQTVCIIDTGINWSHPDLGGCNYTNNISDGSCSKVIGGYDFYNNDSNPMDDNGHGTQDAGIVAAKGGINGTAPDAKLVAMKVCGPSGIGCPTNSIMESIIWCTNNKNLYNISVISISLGGNSSYTEENCPVDLANEINNAYISNISVVISSGNNAFTNGTSWPSCRGNSTSVGSVYDANVGPYIHTICNDTTTQADKIVCKANRGKDLDLFAPGCEIRSTDLVGYGIGCGTSSAAPHVSGVIALMLEKNKNLTPDNIQNLLKSTGKIVYDDKSNLSFPRINAYYAISDEVNISKCRDLTRINYVYNLTNNISSGGTCLTILANNITINGKNYTINFGVNSSGHGVYTNGYNNTKVLNLKIEMKNSTGRLSKGIYISNSIRNNITNNNLIIGGFSTADTDNYGVYLKNAKNSIVENNLINITCQKGYGVFTYATNNEDSSNNSIINNLINTKENLGIGIYISGISGGIARNSRIQGNIIFTNNSDSHGIYLASTSDGTNVFNNKIKVSYGSVSYGVYIASSNNLLKDSNITSLSAYDVNVISGTNNTFVNVTYIDESVSGDLTRKWYLDVKVNDSLGNNVNLANVTGRNVSGSVQFSTLTNSTGMITRQEVIEYLNIGGTKKYYTNYNITAFKTNYSSMYQIVNISTNKYLIFTLMPNKIIFMTNLTYNGDLNGTVGADQLCMADPNKPASGTYKALVGTFNRQISGNDWVLKANTTYTRTNTSITIGYTNSQKWFVFDLDNPITTTPKYVWTGIYENGSVSAYNCDNWTDSVGDGSVGDSNMASSSSIYYTEKSCPLGGRTIYCAEQ